MFYTKEMIHKEFEKHSRQEKKIQRMSKKYLLKELNILNNSKKI